MPVVLKVLVPVGKRGKAGAIRFAGTPEEVSRQAAELLEMTVSHYPVEQVLVEQKLDIRQELYLSITVDKTRCLPVNIAGSTGGIDIEELGKKYPDKISNTHVDPFMGLPAFKTIEIWSGLGLTGICCARRAAVAPGAP